jgi:hypothetical protein
MRFPVLTEFWLIVIAYLFAPYGFADSIVAIRQPGVFVSPPDKACTVALKKSLQGGFMQLYLADDVTAFAWASPSVVVYSVSPVYGSPGVFLAKCAAPRKVTVLVAPSNIDRAYPKGADYFEIRSITGHQIEYFYGDDVDKIDFTQLRSDKNLRRIDVP